MSPKVKLTYFPLRARGELPRALLDMGGVHWEDDVITFEQWPSVKPATPYGQLPVLRWDGLEISQSLGICQYIAKKTGLAGNNPEQAAIADMIMFTNNDIGQEVIKIKFCKDEEEKKKLAEEFAEKKFPLYLQKTEGFLKKAGGQFFTNNGLSYADIATFFVLDRLADKAQMTEGGFSEAQHSDMLKAMSKCALLTAQHQRIKAMPRMAKHLETRNNYSF